MSNKAEFQLGDSVTFSNYWEKPIGEEVNRRAEELDGDEGTIGYQCRENPTPEKVAVLVGIVRRQGEAAVVYAGGERAEFYADWSTSSGFPERTFLVVRYTLRGRQYLVEPKALTKVGGAS